MHDAESASRPRLALRRVRPPALVRVQLDALKPVVFHNREQSFKVAAAYGPWRTSGCWWSAGDWDRDEWDVLIAQEQSAHLLVNDRRQNRWHLEAVYD